MGLGSVANDRISTKALNFLDNSGHWRAAIPLRDIRQVPFRNGSPST
jgi:hypothetical protein